jgi:hypothetical protein
LWVDAYRNRKVAGKKLKNHRKEEVSFFFPPSSQYLSTTPNAELDRKQLIKS